LIVEGPSDLLYLQVMSGILTEEGRVGLDSRWTITPTGGAGKIPTFVALLGAQKGMTIATLVDSSVAEQPKNEDLYKQKLLKKANVLTYADFTNTAEADVEDMFEVDFYCRVASDEFKEQLSAPIDVSKLNANLPRMVQRIDDYLEKNPLKNGPFTHYRPARYFSENSGVLRKKLSKPTKDRFESAFKKLNSLLS